MASTTNSATEAKVSPPDQATAVLLSSIAGFVDAAGFFALFGLFTAHVTGNLVTAGAALARSRPDGVIAKLTMIPVFMISVAATTLIIRAFRNRGKDPLVPLLALLTGSLAVFWFTGTALKPWLDGADAVAVITVGATGVLAMGIQNGMMRQVLGSSAPTTMMTGNLTQFTIELLEVTVPASRGPDGRGAAFMRLKKVGLPLLGFVLGAALGAALTRAFSLSSIGLPTCLAGALTLRALNAAHRTAPVTQQ